jgi:hypothetical protein
MSAADVVLKDAIQDRSFAGLFAYSSNVPMKVFAGNEPAVPVSVLVDALDTLQGGSAPKGAAQAMQYAASAQLSSCQKSCLAQHEACMSDGSQPASCVASAQACAMQCSAPQH